MMCAALRLSYSLERRTQHKYWVTLLVKSEQVVQSPAFLEAHGQPGLCTVLACFANIMLSPLDETLETWLLWVSLMSGNDSTIGSEVHSSSNTQAG